MTLNNILCFLLLVIVGTVIGAATKERRGVILDDKGNIEFPSGDDEDRRRALDSVELNKSKAKAFQRSRRWGVSSWGGTNKQEECREGCYREELEEYGMSSYQILDYMKNYNCKYRKSCPSGTYCMYGTNPIYTHNHRLTVYCNRHGGWTYWTSWTPCTKSCGGGTKTRSRTCTNPTPLNFGLKCYGDSKQTYACNIQECPVDGGLSEWSDWTTCSVSCGSGTQSRNRGCTSPTPENGGKACDGDLTETRDCNEAPCESADLEAGLTDSNIESDTCKLNYLKVPTHHAKGGVAAPDENQDSIDSCKAVCSEVMNCLGYDWDEGDSPYKGIRCWLKNNEFSAIDEVDHYQRREWEGDTISAFMKYLNFHAEGADGNAEAMTVKDCADACLAKDTCLAFDFDRSDKPWKNTRCWMHENELEAWANGNHFMKQPCPMQHNIEP